MQIPKKPPVPQRSCCYLSILLLGVISTGCTPNESNDQGLKSLRLATTTSTYDSGLLDELLPAFKSGYDCRVDVLSMGTGAALKLGEAGNVDVLIVHARAAELAFMDRGHGSRHEEFMENHFVIVGPPSDPARVSGMVPGAAFGQIAAAGHTFVSRGDDSGTHKRELAIWQSTGEFKQWNAYLQVGQGMGATLQIADEKRAYTICDMGTFLNYRERIDLVPVSQPCDELRNPYSVIVVNPTKNNQLNADLAECFVDFLISESTQRQIACFRKNGQQLFRPLRIGSETPPNTADGRGT